VTVPLRNVLAPARWPAVARKVVDRVAEPSGQQAPASSWARARARETGEALGAIDAELWEEADAFARRFQVDAAERLARLDVTLGGGGSTALLYFLTRRKRPHVAVETGVAAGFSSQAILAAMDANGRGHLFSSDLPYFRVRDPERYIGVLVDDALRERWTLLTEGDRRNLPRILRACGPIELVHYDSDKRSRERAWALNRLWPALAPGAVVVIDDIGDNLQFRDFTESRGLDPIVLAFEGKFIGVLGL
jgi:predicted O-methyltransferase YrrM